MWRAQRHIAGNWKVCASAGLSFTIRISTLIIVHWPVFFSRLYRYAWRPIFLYTLQLHSAYSELKFHSWVILSHTAPLLHIHSFLAGARRAPANTYSHIFITRCCSTPVTASTGSRGKPIELPWISKQQSLRKWCGMSPNINTWSDLKSREEEREKERESPVLEESLDSIHMEDVKWFVTHAWFCTILTSEYFKDFFFFWHLLILSCSTFISYMVFIQAF